MAPSSRVQGCSPSWLGWRGGRSARKRREVDAGAQLAVSFLSSPEPWPHHMMLPTFRVCLSTNQT